jgi:hypothetical protein
MLLQPACFSDWVYCRPRSFQRFSMSPDYLYLIVGVIFTTVIGLDIYNWLKGHSFVAFEIRIKRLWSKLNYSILILGVTTLVTAILLNVNILSYRSPMEYSLIDTITLKDFRGFKIPNETLDGTNEFAFITTSIEWEKTDKNVEVHALFHPARSYVYNDKIVDRFLLNHELYHFRVTEIFARKCREELLQSEKAPSDDDIDKILASNKQSENEMQYRYDEESYHGYIMKEQKRWEKEIDSLLNLLDKYKNPNVRYE